LLPNVAAIAGRNVDICLEMGPASLGESVRKSFATDQCPVILPSVLPADGGGADFWTVVGTLYVAGVDFLWQQLMPADAGCVRLPRYPWQRQRLWAPRFGWPPPLASAGKEATLPQIPAAAEPVATPVVRRRPDLTVPYVAPRTKLEEDLVQSWSTILRIEGIGVFDNFFELGGDSLQATILLNRLQEHLGESVPSHALFQVQNISDLAGYLERQCPEAIQRRYGNGQAARGGDGAIPRLARQERAEDLLARLDDLGDDEIESLLGKEMTEGESGRS
jgi:acyl carrier protein